MESTDIPKGSKLEDVSRKSIISSLSDFAAKGIMPKILYRFINIFHHQPQKNNYKNYPKDLQALVENLKLNY